MEQTNHHLGKTLSDQHELEKEVRDLKHQLSTSEKEKVGWQEECAMLVKEYRLQMERDEHARDKMMEIQEKLANSKYVCMRSCTVKNFTRRKFSPLACMDKILTVYTEENYVNLI